MFKNVGPGGGAEHIYIYINEPPTPPTRSFLLASPTSMLVTEKPLFSSLGFHAERDGFFFMKCLAFRFQVPQKKGGGQNCVDENEVLHDLYVWNASLELTNFPSWTLALLFHEEEPHPKQNSFFNSGSQLVIARETPTRNARRPGLTELNHDPSARRHLQCPHVSAHPMDLEDHPRTCKWLITMVIVSPLSVGLVPLPNGSINGGY